MADMLTVETGNWVWQSRVCFTLEALTVKQSSSGGSGMRDGAGYTPRTAVPSICARGSDCEAVILLELWRAR